MHRHIKVLPYLFPPCPQEEKTFFEGRRNGISDMFLLEEEKSKWTFLSLSLSELIMTPHTQVSSLLFSSLPPPPFPPTFPKLFQTATRSWAVEEGLETGLLGPEGLKYPKKNALIQTSQKAKFLGKQLWKGALMHFLVKKIPVRKIQM